MRPRVLRFTAVLIVLLLAASLRFYRIGYQSYWNDEGNSLGLSGRGVGTIVQSAAADIHPPGYYLALKPWAALVGTSEPALRGFSALAGVILVALLYRLGKHYFGPGAGVGAALLGAINPFLVYYAQEARMYALLATLAAASFLLFSQWLRSSRPPAAPWGDRRLGAAYSIITAAGLYTHYAFGFVLLAENLAALGGLLAHGRARAATTLNAAPAPGTPHGPPTSHHGSGRQAQPARTFPASQGRWLAWLGWQTLTAALYLPWAATAWRQLTTWPAERAAPAPGAALLDLSRYLAFGRTLPTSAALAGLAGAAVLLGLGLRRRGQTITPLLWLVVPAGLTLSLGLLTEAFAKFLLVAVPALCLLVGHGLAAVPVGSRSRRGNGQPLARKDQGGHGGPPLREALHGTGNTIPGPRQSLTQYVVVAALWLAATATLAAGTVASLNNLYFNPLYFRDDYRGIARYVEGLARPGDAVITIAPNQVEAFGYYHRAGAPIYPLPRTRPLDPAETDAALAEIAAQHPRLFVLYWGDEQADPEHRVEQWLNTRTFKAGEAWYGQVRLATYAAAAPAEAPSTLSGAVFGEAITLVGYHVPDGNLVAGDILQVTLFWRTDTPMEARYKVFVHLYADPSAPPAAQQDSEPGGGLRPTSTWPAGEVVADNHGVLIPADLPAGEYTLSIGLYELFTNLRLPITLEQAEAGDRLSLGTITIE